MQRLHNTTLSEPRSRFGAAAVKEKVRSVGHLGFQIRPMGISDSRMRWWVREYIRIGGPHMCSARWGGFVVFLVVYSSGWVALRFDITYCSTCG